MFVTLEQIDLWYDNSEYCDDDDDDDDENNFFLSGTMTIKNERLRKHKLKKS